MQKKFLLIIACIISSFVLLAQGVNFEEITFNEALAKAKAENKLVFLDCYIKGCVPCKQMAEVVFPQKEMGDFFNKHFINIKMDMGEGEGPELNKRFSLVAYPTFLIIESDGSLRHKIIGGNKIIENATKGLTLETSTSYFDKRYRYGERSKEFLLAYCKQLSSIYEHDNAGIIATELLANLSDEEKMSPEYWFIFDHSIFSGADSDNFKYLLDNIDGFVENVGKDKVNDKIKSSYIRNLSLILSKYRREGKATATSDLDRIKKEITSNKKIPLKDYLLSNLEIVKALLSEDTSSLLMTCQKGVKTMDDDSFIIMKDALLCLKENLKDNQMVQFNKLVDIVMDKIKDGRKKEYLQNQLKG